MNENEFRRLLQNGHGRAVVYARSHGLAAFHDVLLDEALHCHAVDPQCEGTRADFIRTLLNYLPDRNLIEAAVLDSLGASEDNWHAVQRYEFAAFLAEDGDAQAQRRIYECFNPGPTQGAQIARGIISRDGLSGLLFVAERIGAKLLGGDFSIDFGWLNLAGRQVCGEQIYWDELNRASGANPRIAAFRDAAATYSREFDLDSQSRQDRRTRIEGYSFAEIISGSIQLNRSDLHQWAKSAPESQVMEAAEVLPHLQEAERQKTCLRLFTERLFPLAPEILLDLISSADSVVGRLAVRALAEIQHPAVREFAPQLVAGQSPYRAEAIRLLFRNFRDGDHLLALSWFDAEQDRSCLHSMAIDLRNLIADHPSADLGLPILRSLYEKDPCSFHREFVVRDLLAADALTEQMRAECAWDAEEQVRALVQ